MTITQVKVKPLDNGNLKAIANVTLDDSLVLTGIKVMSGTNGLFVTMPSVKGKEGELDKKTGKQKYYDTFYPITANFRAELMGKVLAEYEGKEVKQEEFVEVDPMDDDDLPF